MRWLIKGNSCRFFTKIFLLMLNPCLVWLCSCNNRKANIVSTSHYIWFGSPLNLKKKCLNLHIFYQNWQVCPCLEYKMHQYPSVELNQLCLNIASINLLHFKIHNLECSTIFLGDKPEQHLTTNDCKGFCSVTLRPVALNPLPNCLKRAFSFSLSFLKIVFLYQGVTQPVKKIASQFHKVTPEQYFINMTKGALQ